MQIFLLISFAKSKFKIDKFSSGIPWIYNKSRHVRQISAEIGMILENNPRVPQAMVTPCENFLADIIRRKWNSRLKSFISDSVNIYIYINHVLFDKFGLNQNILETNSRFPSATVTLLTNFPADVIREKWNSRSIRFRPRSRECIYKSRHFRRISIETGMIPDNNPSIPHDIVTLRANFRTDIIRKKWNSRSTSFRPLSHE